MSNPNACQRIRWIAPAALLAVVVPAFGQGASFQGLGDLPGDDFNSRAFGTSADGAVVVGQSSSGSGTEAFRWTVGGGMVGLGDLRGGSFQSRAYATSADGAVVVGHGVSASGFEAFRWTSGGGMVGLGDFPGLLFSSRAFGVSADGSTVVGVGHNADFSSEAFRWTSGGGMVGLGDLPGGSVGSQAFAVSADGSVVVGSGQSGIGLEAFRWTAGGSMAGLGDLPGGASGSEAFAVSADGAVVVGSSPSASGLEAFRWTAATRMVGLGDLPGGIFSSHASATSADGAVVVGRGSGFGDEAFLWTADDGMRSLRDILVTDYGLDLTGWQLLWAFGISPDGLTIVGKGQNPSGFTEAWIARLEPPNNDPNNPQPINSGETISGDFANASSEGTSSCDPNSVDLFYEVTITTGPATLELDTCGSAADTALAVFDSRMTEIGCNTDCAGTPCGAPDACLTLPGLPAETYLIRASQQTTPLAGGSPTSFMLTALVTDCPWDLDDNGDVGVKDLLFLLGTWGPCPKKGDCPADFDNSSAVDVKDLLFLLGAWGPCP